MPVKAAIAQPPLVQHGPSARLPSLLPILQQQAYLVLASTQLSILRAQLTSVSSLWQAIAPLMPGLQRLAATNPSVSALLIRLQQLSGSTPTMGGLIQRVALLKQLLTELAKRDPHAAGRIAALLPTLRQVLLNLHAANTRLSTLAGQAFGNFGVASVSPFTSSTDTPGALGGTTAPSQNLAADGPAIGLGQQIRNRASTAAHVHAATGSIAPPAPLSMIQLTQSAASAAGGGSSGGGAPPLALLMVAVLALVAVWLPGRMSLEVPASISTLVAGRLERPG